MFLSQSLFSYSTLMKEPPRRAGRTGGGGIQGADLLGLLGFLECLGKPLGARGAVAGLRHLFLPMRSSKVMHLKLASVWLDGRHMHWVNEKG